MHTFLKQKLSYVCILNKLLIRVTVPWGFYPDLDPTLRPNKIRLLLFHFGIKVN